MKVTHDVQHQYGGFLDGHHREHSKLKLFLESGRKPVTRM